MYESCKSLLELCNTIHEILVNICQTLIYEISLILAIPGKQSENITLAQSFTLKNKKP
jgi:hypothetical protein